MPVIRPLDAFDFWLDCVNVDVNVDAVTGRCAAHGAARRFLRSLRNLDRGQSVAND
jgi:hypothetical protein